MLSKQIAENGDCLKRSKFTVAGLCKKLQAKTVTELIRFAKKQVLLLFRVKYFSHYFQDEFFF